MKRNYSAPCRSLRTVYSFGGSCSFILFLLALQHFFSAKMLRDTNTAVAPEQHRSYEIFITVDNTRYLIFVFKFRSDCSNGWHNLLDNASFQKWIHRSLKKYLLEIVARKPQSEGNKGLCGCLLYPSLWSDKAAIKKLHRRNRKVFCYFSLAFFKIGNLTEKKYLSLNLGNVLDGWKEETWKYLDAADNNNMNDFDDKKGSGLEESRSVNFVKFLPKVVLGFWMAEEVKLKNL